MDHSLDHEALPDSNHGPSPVEPMPVNEVEHGGCAEAAAAFPSGENSSRPADGSAQTYWVWAICGFLLLAVGLVFGQTLGHQFVGWDDRAYLSENPHVTAGLTLPGLWWALTDGPFGEWFPLSTLSNMLDCQLYGVNPAGHNLTSVLLHAASSVLLFLVLRRMTGDLWPSAWVAAVFAIHPLRVESVAWVAERRDVLSGLFFMLTLGAYTLYAERPSLARYLPVFALLTLGLMAKPMLVTVPFLLLLLDYWPLHRFGRAAGSGPQPSDVRPGRWPIVWRLVVEKIPLLAVAAAACAITLATHTAARSTGSVEQLSLTTRLANGLVSYAVYVGQSLCPVGLVPFYPHPGTRLSAAWLAGAVILLAAMTAIAVYGWRRRPYLLVGWLWFLGMLVPVSGVVQLVAIAQADRYTYLSQTGLMIALAWGVWNVYQARQARHAEIWRQWMLATVSGAAVLVLAAMAWRQTACWRNAETLWTHTIACTDKNLLALYNLAFTYVEEGRTDEAIACLREAVTADSIDPQLMAKSHCLLADGLAKQGKVDEALAEYEQAERIYPASSVFHDRLAKEFRRRGNYDRAIAEWREVVRLQPQQLRGRMGLADALLAHGETAAAIAECQEVLAQDPFAIQANLVLGEALATEGKAEEAIGPLKRALDVQADNAQAHFHLGVVLYDLNRSRVALEHLEQAIHLQPDNVEIVRQTAWILATSPDATVRDGTRAVELAARAVQLSAGQDWRAFDAEAAALAETGQFPLAIEAAQQASALAMAGGDAASVAAIEQRMRQYRQALPYRRPAPPKAGQAPVGQAPQAPD